MAQKEITTCKYQFAEDTAKLIDAVRRLDDIFIDVEECVSERFVNAWLGVYSSIEATGKDGTLDNPFIENFKALRCEIERVIHEFIDESLADRENTKL